MLLQAGAHSLGNLPTGVGIRKGDQIIRVLSYPSRLSWLMDPVNSVMAQINPDRVSPPCPCPSPSPTLLSQMRSCAAAPHHTVMESRSCRGPADSGSPSLCRDRHRCADVIYGGGAGVEKHTASF
ncbi:hypothetical protein SKAU_G00085690 [Synaphobranchus kaupii]|uniref:Uncharacterized protein n=1 Tax=Synaphobranchus kaupii TaxID=118154 RepID=A0A9Q1FWK3_SYNKA|nr:hypothetical protein SKAU_G00085690 [Synaphobranchus kaupii]